MPTRPNRRERGERPKSMRRRTTEETGATGHDAPISETVLGYDVVAPLWTILELGAVAEAGVRALRDARLGGFVTARRNDIDRSKEPPRPRGT